MYENQYDWVRKYIYMAGKSMMSLIYEKLLLGPIIRHTIIKVVLLLTIIIFWVLWYSGHPSEGLYAFWSCSNSLR